VSKLSRFVNLWRARQLDRDLDDELSFHIEMRVEKNLRNGMERPEAKPKRGDTWAPRRGPRKACAKHA
jgi:hypothetical protein